MSFSLEGREKKTLIIQQLLLERTGTYRKNSCFTGAKEKLSCSESIFFGKHYTDATHHLRGISPLCQPWSEGKLFLLFCNYFVKFANNFSKLLHWNLHWKF
jgi:hypothetical protein